jgi:uncharacterized protein (DUF305 family)
MLRAGILASAIFIAAIGPVAAQGGHHDHASPASDGSAASTQEFRKADAEMMENMKVPYTGNPDVDFRTHMIPHHEGAVAMAKVALRHAKDESTRQMARKIIEDQEKEIAEMRQWLKANGHQN